VAERRQMIDDLLAEVFEDVEPARQERDQPAWR